MVLDPHLVPGYEILERLASGGVAEVFRARRAADGQEVALKLMSLQDVDPEFRPRERFQREGQLLSRLSHPSLPHLHGFGVTESGFGWIAQELVHGRPLSELSGRPVSELLPVFIQIAEALEEVAAEGIVHRDISPDNILVEDRHGRLHARLIDFGIAKDILAGEAGGLTRHGAFIGKLAYASPEQLVGPPKGEMIDFRSDVYSLGLTLYELLAGRKAIEGGSLPEIVDAHLTGSYPPLVIPPEHGGPAPCLRALVTRMAARRREDRPASWAEVISELWKAREEAAPLTMTLARKKVTRSGEEASATFPEPAAVEPATQGGAAAVPPIVREGLSREVLFGRVVLAVGIVAFLGAALFAIIFVSSHPVGPTPAPVPSPAVRPAKALAPPTPLAVPTPTEPLPTAPPTAEAKTGAVTLALAPQGDLEEVLDEGGRRVAGRRPLPARLELPPGRYRVRLVGRGIDCAKSVTITVEAGRTASVRESCIEVK